MGDDSGGALDGVVFDGAADDLSLSLSEELRLFCELLAPLWIFSPPRSTSFPMPRIVLQPTRPMEMSSVPSAMDIRFMMDSFHVDRCGLETQRLCRVPRGITIAQCLYCKQPNGACIAAKVAIIFAMKRLLILLLICLLPMQVFAGVRAFQIDQAGDKPASWQKASVSADAVQLAEILDEDDDGAYDGDEFSDESFSQTGASDETMLMPLPAFPDDPLVLTHALRHDAVRQPPFLPLPGRPPRV